MSRCRNCFYPSQRSAPPLTYSCSHVGTCQPLPSRRLNSLQRPPGASRGPGGSEVSRHGRVLGVTPLPASLSPPKSHHRADEPPPPAARRHWWLQQASAGGPGSPAHLPRCWCCPAPTHPATAADMGVVRTPPTPPCPTPPPPPPVLVLPQCPQSKPRLQTWQIDIPDRKDTMALWNQASVTPPSPRPLASLSPCSIGPGLLPPPTPPIPASVGAL